jgi:hypothetical protein
MRYWAVSPVLNALAKRSISVPSGECCWKMRESEKGVDVAQAAAAGQLS